MNDFRNDRIIYIALTVFFLLIGFFYLPPPFLETDALAQEYFEYQIKEGDCLWTIAHQFQLSIQEVVEANNIDQEQILLPGLLIKIPQEQPGYAATDIEKPTMIHTVQKGENLWDIAQQYRLSLDCISSVNDLKKPDSLYIGQKIKIPIDKDSTIESGSKNDLVYEENNSNFQGMSTSLNQEFRNTIEEIDYTVKPGESLWTIAQNYQVSLKDLSDINHLENEERLSIGQIIKIPLGNGSKTETNEEGIEVTSEGYPVNWVEHIVEYGENISIIAQKYHLPVDTICELNEISQQSYIYPGQRLKIKASSQITDGSEPARVNEQENMDTKEQDVLIEEEYQPIHYVVQPGDTLWSIAQNYYVSVESILAVNYLNNKDVLSIGQKLEIPALGGVYGSKVKQKIVVYKVVKGDTLWNIATKFDVKMHEIININQLQNITQLSIGQELNIPVTGEIAEEKEQDKTAEIVKEEKPKNIMHYVQKGETLWEISRKYQVSLQSIANANHITESGRIIAGQKLIIPNVRSSSLSSNAFIWPLKGLITSQFGMRTLGGRKDYHTGIDIDGRTGVSIRVAESGKVSFSGYINGYGNVVIIDHKNGYSTVYAHNSSNLVIAGQLVNKGDIIAKLGSTGNSTGSHLHFEIRENGKPVNPLNYLP